MKQVCVNGMKENALIVYRRNAPNTQTFDDVCALAGWLANGLNKVLGSGGVNNTNILIKMANALSDVHYLFYGLLI